MRLTASDNSSAAGKTVDIDFTGRLASNDLDGVKAFVLRGLGIGLLPEFTAEEAGLPAALVRVLPGYASEVRPIYFAYPAQRFGPPSVRAFIAIAAADHSQP